MSASGLAPITETLPPLLPPPASGTAAETAYRGRVPARVLWKMALCAAGLAPLPQQSRLQAPAAQGALPPASHARAL